MTVSHYVSRRTRKKKFSSVLIYSQEQLCGVNQSQLLLCGQCVWQLGEAAGIWQCYEELFSICQTLRVTACQGKFSPRICDCKTSFCKKHWFQWRWKWAHIFFSFSVDVVSFYDSAFHVYLIIFPAVKKKSSVSFRQTMVKFFHFTSFSRPVFLLVAKGSSPKRRTWMAKHREGGNLNLNVLLDQIYHLNQMNNSLFAWWITFPLFLNLQVSVLDPRKIKEITENITNRLLFCFFRKKNISPSLSKVSKSIVHSHKQYKSIYRKLEGVV